MLSTWAIIVTLLFEQSIYYICCFDEITVILVHSFYSFIHSFMHSQDISYEGNFLYANQDITYKRKLNPHLFIRSLQDTSQSWGKLFICKSRHIYKRILTPVWQTLWHQGEFFYATMDNETSPTLLFFVAGSMFFPPPPPPLFQSAHRLRDSPILIIIIS